jgi:putative tryptophan/tyrosine transport system substrate-binding protein
MRRREFFVFLGGAAAVWPGVGWAQSLGRRPLIAFLAGQTPAAGTRYTNVFMQRMKELGYVEDRDIEFAFFHADGDMSRLPALAAEIVLRKPDVIVATNIQAVVAMKQQTSQIPIVGTVLSDAIELGLVASHARPGGNVTGTLVGVDTLPGKQLALVKEIVPDAVRMGILFNAGIPTLRGQHKNVEEAAATMSIKLVSAGARSVAELDAAFQTLARERVAGVVVLGDPMFFFQRARIARLALEARLPTAFPLREHAEAGGLMSYGVDQRANFRRTAEISDKILKGAKPAELPVELPTTFELVINLKTAKAIGLTVSESILLRADEVIE